MNLHRVTVSAPYYREYDGGKIDTLKIGAIVDKTDFVSGGKVYIKLGTWDGTNWAESGKTGWFNENYLEPFVPDPVEPEPPPTPTGEKMLQYDANGILIRIWIPE
jgi:hypothetical protein